jgi:RNA polymerase sigma-70 factor (ECF subfamily)
MRHQHDTIPGDVSLCQCGQGRAHLTCDCFGRALEHRRELYARALQLTRNRALAEDVLQETLTRAFGAWERFDGRNVRAWLHRILTNAFITHWRSESRGRIARDRLRRELDEAVGPDVPEGLSDEVQAALLSLPMCYWSVIVLADMKGESYRRIAEMIGAPIGTVMSRLFRGRRLLRSALSEYARAEYGLSGSM